MDLTGERPAVGKPRALDGALHSFVRQFGDLNVSECQIHMHACRRIRTPKRIGHRAYTPVTSHPFNGVNAGFCHRQSALRLRGNAILYVTEIWAW